LAASPEELEAKLKALQEQVDVLRRELEETRAQRAVPPASPATATAAPAPAPPVAAPAPATERPFGLTDFKIGGYGSTRFEASDLSNLNNTFTFRRFVLSGDATIAGRLRSVVELEFERLTELEVERTSPSEDGRRGFSQSLEGSDKSELSLEQAW